MQLRFFWKLGESAAVVGELQGTQVRNRLRWMHLKVWLGFMTVSMEKEKPLQFGCNHLRIACFGRQGALVGRVC